MENLTGGKCFWEVTGVDSNGDYIIKVFNEARQKELNALVGSAESKYKKDKEKTLTQDDKYAELVEALGFEANMDLFSAAGKSYVYNVKKELAKDLKQKANADAIKEGKANKQTTTKTPKEQTVVQSMVVVGEGAW